MSVVVHSIVKVDVSCDRNQWINGSSGGVDTVNLAPRELSFQSILHLTCQLFQTARFRREELDDILREIVHVTPNLN